MEAPPAFFVGLAVFGALGVADLAGEAEGSRFVGVPWLAGPSSNKESKDGAGDGRDVWIGGTVLEDAGTGGGGMDCGDESFDLAAFFASPGDLPASLERRRSNSRKRAFAARGADALSGSSSLLLSLSTTRFCFPFAAAALALASLLLLFAVGGRSPASSSALRLALAASRFLRM